MHAHPHAHVQASPQQTVVTVPIGTTQQMHASPIQNMDMHIASANANHNDVADLYYLQNLDVLQTGANDDHDAEDDEEALDTIHSLMNESKFVDTENSYYTKLSPKNRKKNLKICNLMKENKRSIVPMMMMIFVIRKRYKEDPGLSIMVMIEGIIIISNNIANIIINSDL
eukprot:TRINITY_DN116_c0_g1_i1.p1 TRINITY_DN116_c0_g1~~TRINITY_DN116_c0_g1_i1.p1  ORF type:complete len:170 (-),score=55.79 TRINITY_DN116_c0_g1_i1:275-784(-)